MNRENMTLDKISLLDLLPLNLRKNQKVIAICKAYDIQFRKRLEKVEKLKVWNNIDSLDDKTLDFMALELNTHFYSQEFTLDKKRALIKNCIKWYSRLGTREALEEIISTIYKNFKVYEWFEYDGEPFFFKVNVNLGDNPLTEEDFKKLNYYIHYAKNVRSWLEEIDINSDIPQNEITLGSGLACDYSRVEINIDMPKNLNFNNTISKLTDIAIAYSRTELPIKTLEDININSNVTLPSKITTNYIKTEVIE